MEKPLPINIEPFETLRRRFSEAVKNSYDTLKIAANPKDRPGQKPEHVFDFDDGIRLIISRDRFNEKEVLHFSGSVLPGYPIETGLPPRLYLAKFLGECTEKITKLSGCRTSDVKLVAITQEKGIPHWIVELSNLN